MAALARLINKLSQCITPLQYLHGAAGNPTLFPHTDRAVQDLTVHIKSLLDELAGADSTRDSISQWIRDQTSRQINSELTGLTNMPGFQLGANSASAERLESISYDQVSADMQASAPILWDILGTALSPDREVLQRRRDRRKAYAQRKGRGGSRSWGAYDGQDAVMQDVGDDVNSAGPCVQPPAEGDEDDLFDDLPDDFGLLGDIDALRVGREAQGADFGREEENLSEKLDAIDEYHSLKIRMVRFFA